jgi:hypothetical protein
MKAGGTQGGPETASGMVILRGTRNTSKILERIASLRAMTAAAGRQVSFPIGVENFITFTF